MSSSSKDIKGNELSQLQKTVSQQLKTNCEIQGEILKAMQNYREAAEIMAERSDELAQSIGKFALASQNSFNASKELSPETINEHQQRQLFAALQQIVRFSTHISSELQALANTISHEFDRPIQLNLEKYRQVSSNWEKDFEKDVRKVQHDIKNKEQEATKAGRKSSKDMSKLSSSLQALSGIVGELEKVKSHRLEQAFYTDHKQYLFVAHHLQKYLKAEIGSHKAIYYHDRVKKQPNSSETDQFATPSKNADAEPGLLPPKRVQSIFPSAIDSSSTPNIPRTAHRKTIVASAGDDLRAIIDQNFESQPGTQAVLPDCFRKSVFVSKETLKQMKSLDHQESTTDRALIDQDSAELALVIYDYPARAQDDLNVLEGDIVRVIAVEGEWLYGLLLVPAEQDSNEYVPSEVDGVHQVGWLPVSFTTSL